MPHPPREFPLQMVNGPSGPPSRFLNRSFCFRSPCLLRFRWFISFLKPLRSDLQIMICIAARARLCVPLLDPYISVYAFICAYVMHIKHSTSPIRGQYVGSFLYYGGEEAVGGCIRETSLIPLLRCSCQKSYFLSLPSLFRFCKCLGLQTQIYG